MNERTAMFTLSRWPYIKSVTFSGDMQTDITNLLATNGKPKTAAHSIAVAKTNKTLTARFGLDQTAASASAFLHDISSIMKPRDMLAYAVGEHWEIDPAERKHPFLLHQRLSAVIASELFKINDALILSAISCHSTLKPDPSDFDMALFLADKLSWDQEGAPPYYEAVTSALDRSLRGAALAYIDFGLEHGMILSPHQWFLGAKRWLEEHA